MQKTDKILEFTIPLRLYYNTLSDEEFEIVLAGLSLKELEILRLVYGKEYSKLELEKLPNYEKTILYRVLTEKIPKRVNLVLKNRDKTLKESPESAEVLKKVSIKKNIYDYFRQYKHETVVFAILRLDPKDYQILMMMCAGDLTKPLDLKIYPKFYHDLYSKIERRLLNSKNYDIKNIPAKNVLDEEVKRSIEIFIESQTYQDLLTLFTFEEALLYAMYYGLIDGKTFSIEAISVILELDSIEIQSLLGTISSKLQSKPSSISLKRQKE